MICLCWELIGEVLQYLTIATKFLMHNSLASVCLAEYQLLLAGTAFAIRVHCNRLAFVDGRFSNYYFLTNAFNDWILYLSCSKKTPYLGWQIAFTIISPRCSWQYAPHKLDSQCFERINSTLKALGLTKVTIKVEIFRLTHESVAIESSWQLSTHVKEYHPHIPKWSTSVMASSCRRLQSHLWFQALNHLNKIRVQDVGIGQEVQIPLQQLARVNLAAPHRGDEAVHVNAKSLATRWNLSPQWTPKDHRCKPSWKMIPQKKFLKA